MGLQGAREGMSAMRAEQRANFFNNMHEIFPIQTTNKREMNCHMQIFFLELSGVFQSVR